MELYLSTLEITRGMNEEEHTEVFTLGIFDNFEQAKMVAQTEFNKNIITDEQMQNIQRIWDKYKTKYCTGYYTIPKENEELLYAELNESNLKEVFEDENCLMDSITSVQIYAYQLNTAYIQDRGDVIFRLINENKDIYPFGE